MTINNSDFELCRDLVWKNSGVVLGDDKEYLVELRLRKLAQSESIDSLTVLFKRLRNESERSLAEQVVEAMVNTETQFFRDRNYFEMLRLSILPELRDSLTPGLRLNVWCAAASSGQEPYSVAMLLAEHFPDLANGRVRLIGSDISRKMLSRARQGVYKPIEIERGLSPELRDKYFRKMNGQWQVAPKIRAQVEFLRINLIDNWPALPSMDLILIRNVLLYFDDRTKRLVIEKAKHQLKRGGYMILGATEAPSVDERGFELTRFGRTVCFRSNLRGP